MNEAGAPTSRCLNCEHPLPEARPNFCPQCGQETTLRPPRLLDFVQQWGGAFVSTEGALWRTLKLLVLRPGELTRQYLAGRRRHYVLPLRLYLTTSVIVLLLIRLAALGAEEPAIVVNEDLSAGAEFTLEVGFGRVGRKGGQFYCEGLPAWSCKRFRERLALEPEQFQRELARTGERIVANVGAAMFLLLPSFALFTMLAYRNRRLRYTEHLVFALHLHAFWFLAIALTLPNIGWLAALGMLALPSYTLLALGRVFRDRWWTRLLRAAFIGTLYAVMLALAMMMLSLYALLA